MPVIITIIIFISILCIFFIVGLKAFTEISKDIKKENFKGNEITFKDRIKKIKYSYDRKIFNIKKELELIPEHASVKNIIEEKHEAIKKLEEEKIEKIYKAITKEKNNTDKVFVYLNADISNIPEDIKKIYKTISTDLFKTDKITFIDIWTLKRKIENFMSVYYEYLYYFKEKPDYNKTNLKERHKPFPLELKIITNIHSDELKEYHKECPYIRVEEV